MQLTLSGRSAAVPFFSNGPFQEGDEPNVTGPLVKSPASSALCVYLLGSVLRLSESSQIEAHII